MLYNAYSQKLTGQVRSRKDPMSYLNVILVGPTSSGKTAFMRTLCERMKHNIIQGTFRESKPMVLKEPIRPTEELYSVSMHIEEHGQRTALTLVDTPGFTTGFSVDHQLRYIAKYIDHQFELTLAEETKIRRDSKALDTHIHACIYFIDTKVSGLSDVDRYVIKLLGSRVNVLPVIGKADTLTQVQRENIKSGFRKEVFDVLHAPVYGYIEVDDEDEDIEEDGDEDNSANSEKMVFREKAQSGQEEKSSGRSLEGIIHFLQECIDEDDDKDAHAMLEYLDVVPFTLISYEEDPDTGRPMLITPNSKENHTPFGDLGNDSDEEGISSSPSPILKPSKSKPVLGRRYPWAVVECGNPDHCDFEKLKMFLLGSHRDMLRVDTFERFYEKYRSAQLLNRRADQILNLKTRTPHVST
ncbi:Septin-domain-containing protein [Phycomyces blakesleeanus]|uniref:Septin-domain-containing protein n=1 Tax=Phycomyces blakesleeanus TaxID=4837 RepID=A0ABR3B5D5_PHYBL